MQMVFVIHHTCMFMTYAELSVTCLSLFYVYFTCQEKEVGKNKLVPRLLGITKDDIVRVDEKTKKVSPVFL